MCNHRQILNIKVVIIGANSIVVAGIMVLLLRFARFYMPVDGKTRVFDVTNQCERIDDLVVLYIRHRKGLSQNN